MNKKIFSENCNLSSYTTIKVGGVAEYFAEPRSIEEFLYLIKWANLNKHRCQIIGAGSNLLINNIVLKGLVVCTKKLKSLKIEPYSGIVEAEAGVMLPTLSNSLAKNGLQGGEWAVGIPGTLGGAIYMNAGTGNLSLAKNLISVKVINNKTNEKLEIEKKDINFSDKIQKEDILICEEVQKNLLSIGFEKGIISNKYEIGVKHFQDYIRSNIN